MVCNLAGFCAAIKGELPPLGARPGLLLDAAIRTQMTDNSGAGGGAQEARSASQTSKTAETDGEKGWKVGKEMGRVHLEVRRNTDLQGFVEWALFLLLLVRSENALHY